MSSSTCNSILLKLSFKNIDILLNSFKTEAFYYILCKLWANAHFAPSLCVNKAFIFSLFFFLFLFFFHICYLKNSCLIVSWTQICLQPIRKVLIGGKYCFKDNDSFVPLNLSILVFFLLFISYSPTLFTELTCQSYASKTLT